MSGTPGYKEHALVLRRRWAVDDPVLDCALMIIDLNNDREYLAEEADDESRLYWPNDLGDAMFMLWHAADHLKAAGKIGYVWVDLARLQASEALYSLGMILMHERKIIDLLKGKR